MAQILLVDSEIAGHVSLRSDLTRAGHVVCDASDAGRALRLLEADGFGVVLAERNLNGPSGGLELLTQVRAQQVSWDVPFVLLCRAPLPGAEALVNLEAVLTREAMNLGADDVLVWPFSAEELLASVQARLDRDALRRASVYTLKVLGDEALLLNGQPVQWVSRKSLELFAYLHEHPGATAAELWRALWPDRALWPGREATLLRGLFHSTLYRLRQSLGPQAVVLTGQGYFIGPAFPVHSDAGRFEALASPARLLTLTLEELRLAVQGYAGYLPGFSADWAGPRRAQLQGYAVTFGVRAGDLAFQAGRPAEALAFYRQAQDLDPFDVRVAEGLRRSEALALTGTEESATG